MVNRWFPKNKTKVLTIIFILFLVVLCSLVVLEKRRQSVALDFDMASAVANTKALANYKETLIVDLGVTGPEDSPYYLERTINVADKSNKKFLLSEKSGFNSEEGFSGAEYNVISNEDQKYFKLNSSDLVNPNSYPFSKWISIPSQEYPEITEAEFNYEELFLKKTLTSVLPSLDQLSPRGYNGVQVYYSLNSAEEISMLADLFAPYQQFDTATKNIVDVWVDMDPSKEQISGLKIDFAGSTISFKLSEIGLQNFEPESVISN